MLQIVSLQRIVGILQTVGEPGLVFHTHACDECEKLEAKFLNPQGD